MSRLRHLFFWLLLIFSVACTGVEKSQTPTPPTRAAATATARSEATATRQAAAATPTRLRATATRAPTVTPQPTLTQSATSSLGTLTMYMLDVGQADSILLMGPDFTILIDTGKREKGLVVSYLKEIGVESIDLLVGTHPHADHIGQFAEVLQTFPVSEVWMSGDLNTTATFEDSIEAVAASGAGYHEPRAGEVFQLGSARIEVLNPAHLTGEANEGSVMFRLIFGDVAFMFTGDAEAPTEREVLESGRDLRAQILKLGHHGSDTSSTLAFLLAVEPELAIWSAGFDNSYGHPSPKTLENLAMLGIRTLGTLDEDTIVVSTDGKSYEVLDYEGEVGEKTPEASPTRTPTPSGSRPTLTPTPRPSTTGCAPGQININTASEEELEEITQIGPARAALMIELRPFSSVDDMVRVSGITATALQTIKEQGLACVE